MNLQFFEKNLFFEPFNHTISTCFYNKAMDMGRQVFKNAFATFFGLNKAIFDYLINSQFKYTVFDYLIKSQI